MLEIALSVAGIALALIFGFFPYLWPSMPRRWAWAGVLAGVGLLVASAIILALPDRKSVPPEVGLRFVNPTEPQGLLLNDSSTVAREIKWGLVVWNAELADRKDPLPIPIMAFDWLKPGARGGPHNLFRTPMVLPLLKRGDRLVGSAWVSCSACVSDRRYVVSIVWGEGGWYADLAPSKGNFVVPRSPGRDGLVDLIRFAESVPLNRRKKITRMEMPDEPPPLK